MDADNNGTITVDELRRGLAKQGTKLSEAEVEQLMEAVSIIRMHAPLHWHLVYNFRPRNINTR